uniref:RNase NYN domain-containing protein n=1 Tax=Globisporangium ultimum (strain ATCC 200006 / CBS 805.95 / DAOM BR144) TaxID=431595 RepID=K3X641_GLOUD
MAAPTTACTIVIDGANVACQKDGTPSIAKLAAAIAHFQAFRQQTDGVRGAIKCVAFAPNFWLNAKSSASGVLEAEADRVLLSSLVEKDHVILTPSQAHDDFYVIDYAVKYDGFIVTNDMFRDHVANKRTFHGKKLSSTWVKTHCIDFTFVGKEFLPNSRAIERVHSYIPSVPASTTSASVSSPVAAIQQPPSKPLKGSSLANGVRKSSSNDEASSDEEDEGGENDMLVDQRAKLKRNIDLSEVTHYKVPRSLLPFLHGEGGDTMNRFQEYTGTYIVLPSLASVSATQARSLPEAANLSIYG